MAEVSKKAWLFFFISLRILIINVHFYVLYMASFAVKTMQHLCVTDLCCMSCIDMKGLVSSAFFCPAPTNLYTLFHFVALADFESHHKSC